LNRFDGLVKLVSLKLFDGDYVFVNQWSYFRLR
jgi:hypothetical protein